MTSLGWAGPARLDLIKANYKESLNLPAGLLSTISSSPRFPAPRDGNTTVAVLGGCMTGCKSKTLFFRLPPMPPVGAVTVRLTGSTNAWFSPEAGVSNT